MASIDPIYQQQQQQYFYKQGLERAKTAQKERKASRVKLGAILLPVFALAIAAIFILGGGLRPLGSHHVIVDGISYRIEVEKDTVVSRDKGFTEAGKLYFTEDWKHSEQNYATDLNADAVIYVNPNDRSKIYLRWSGHFLLCKRERNILLK